jgi:hypothetical protein
MQTLDVNGEHFLQQEAFFNTSTLPPLPLPDGHVKYNFSIGGENRSAVVFELPPDEFIDADFLSMDSMKEAQHEWTHYLRLQDAWLGIGGGTEPVTFSIMWLAKLWCKNTVRLSPEGGDLEANVLRKAQDAGHIAGDIDIPKAIIKRTFLRLEKMMELNDLNHNEINRTRTKLEEAIVIDKGFRVVNIADGLVREAKFDEYNFRSMLIVALGRHRTQRLMEVQNKRLFDNMVLKYRTVYDKLWEAAHTASKEKLMELLDRISEYYSKNQIYGDPTEGLERADSRIRKHAVIIWNEVIGAPEMVMGIDSDQSGEILVKLKAYVDAIRNLWIGRPRTDEENLEKPSLFAKNYDRLHTMRNVQAHTHMSMHYATVWYSMLTGDGPLGCDYASKEATDEYALVLHAAAWKFGSDHLKSEAFFVRFGFTNKNIDYRAIKEKSFGVDKLKQPDENDMVLALRDPKSEPQGKFRGGQYDLIALLPDRLFINLPRKNFDKWIERYLTTIEGAASMTDQSRGSEAGREHAAEGTESLIHPAQAEKGLLAETTTAPPQRSSISTIRRSSARMAGTRGVSRANQHARARSTGETHARKTPKSGPNLLSQNPAGMPKHEEVPKPKRPSRPPNPNVFERLSQPRNR